MSWKKKGRQQEKLYKEAFRLWKEDEALRRPPGVGPSVTMQYDGGTPSVPPPEYLNLACLMDINGKLSYLLGAMAIGLPVVVGLLIPILIYVI
jgi:hypothetical protein